MDDQASGSSGNQAGKAILNWFANPPKLPQVPRLSSPFSSTFSFPGLSSMSSPSSSFAADTPPGQRSQPNSSPDSPTSSSAPSTPLEADNFVHVSGTKKPQEHWGRVFGDGETRQQQPPPAPKSSSTGNLLKSSAPTPSTTNEKDKAKNRDSVVPKEAGLDVLDDSRITRDHWQPDSAADRCGSETCGKSLVGSLFRKKSHCRRCGRIFCDTCCNYQIRLDANANHDPENGYWCRVCHQCFVARKGYSQEFGPTRNHTKHFKKLRGAGREKQGLEASRLEMRLEKLQKIYADDSLTTAAKREKEKSLITWADETIVTNCPTCLKPFSLISNRKHHCRLCGEVTCAGEECSNMVIVSKTSDRDQVRACLKCITLLTKSRKKEEGKQAAPNPVVRYYEELKNTQEKLADLIPKFNEEMVIFNAATDDRPKRAAYENAAALRQTILQQFQLLEALAKRIAGIPTSDPSSAAQRVQNNVMINVNNYLQNHMFTLALLPNTWKSGDGKSKGDPTSMVAMSGAATPSTSSSPSSSSSSPSSTSLSAQKSSQKKGREEEVASGKKKAQPLSEVDKRKNGQTVEVLFEQKAQIDSFITKFKKEGQMEEVATLIASKREIEAEIKRLQSLS